ncbi:MAG: 3-hydroxyacyl-CoA dehydrogenase NAD-binding domain-containing protein, partial [Pseudomonadota bacterium]
MPAISMTPQDVSDYIAQAGRDAWLVPDVPAHTTRRPIEKVGVIGAGTMGGGISMNFATAGIPVTILERQQEALDRGLGVVRGHYQR